LNRSWQAAVRIRRNPILIRLRCRTGAGNESIELRRRLRGERDLHGAHSTLEVFGLAPADDRGGHARSAQEPGQGDRRGWLSRLLAEPLVCFQHRSMPLADLPHAFRGLVAFPGLVEGARQHSLCQGLVGYLAHPVGLAGWKDLRLHVTA
jgi:hypothetical protein